MKSLAILIILSSMAFSAEFDAIKILPRQDDPAFAQTIKDWKVESSNDSLAWVELAHGTFDSSLTEKAFELGKHSARFVRFTGLSGNSGDLAAIAEINLSLAGVNLSRLGWQASADSAASDYPASNAIDGKPDTCWHTGWTPVAPYPHAITLDTIGPIVGDAVMLQWDANPPVPAITGYVISFGTNPALLDKVQTVANVTETTIPGLAPGTWYFSAQARSITGILSQSCPMVSAVLVSAPVAEVPPTIPTGLHVVPPAPISTALKPATK